MCLAVFFFFPGIFTEVRPKLLTLTGFLYYSIFVLLRLVFPFLSISHCFSLCLWLFQLISSLRDKKSIFFSILTLNFKMLTLNCQKMYLKTKIFTFHWDSSFFVHHADARSITDKKAASYQNIRYFVFKNDEWNTEQPSSITAWTLEKKPTNSRTHLAFVFKRQGNNHHLFPNKRPGSSRRYLSAPVLFSSDGNVISG